MELYATAFAVISAGLGVWALLQYDDFRHRLGLTAMSATGAIHFAMLGEMVPALVRVISTTRAGLSIYVGSPHYAWLFISLYALVWWFERAFWYDVLPLLAASAITLSMYYLSGYRMRLGMLVGSVIWIVFNLIVWSPVMAAYEVLMATINIRMAISMYSRKLNENVDY